MVIKIINGTEIITYKGCVYSSIHELVSKLKGEFKLCVK